MTLVGEMIFLGLTCNGMNVSSLVLPAKDSWTGMPVLCDDGSSLRFIGTIPHQISNFGLDHLESFSIPNQGLSGTLPPLGVRSVLKSLKLDQNLFTGFLPLEYLSVIDELDLSGNMIKGFQKDVQGHVQFAAKKVNLAFNNFSDLLPLSHFYPDCLMSIWPRNLVYLNFSHNNISSNINIIMNSFFYFDNSNVVLDLSYNNLVNEKVGSACFFPPREDVARVSFDNLDRFRFLDISHNNLNSTINISVNSHLISTLVISHNEFEGSIPGAVNNLISLEVFDCSHNFFSSVIPSFSQLTRMKYLDLSNNNLEGPLPFDMRLLLDLQVLSLEENNLTSPIPVAFRDLRKLHFFSYGNSITTSQITDTDQCFPWDYFEFSENITCNTSDVSLCSCDAPPKCHSSPCTFGTKKLKSLIPSLVLLSIAILFPFMFFLHVKYQGKPIFNTGGQGFCVYIGNGKNLCTILLFFGSSVFYIISLVLTVVSYTRNSDIHSEYERNIGIVFAFFSMISQMIGLWRESNKADNSATNVPLMSADNSNSVQSNIII